MEIIYHHFETLASTNDWAKEALPSFDTQALTVVSADTQTEGRGQYGKKWISPARRNLYASFAFFLKQDLEPLLLTRLLAQCAAAVLKEKGVESALKYPNDLLVGRKKIAGILCETLPFSSECGIVIGIGINVNMRQEELNAINQPATSLLQETERRHDPKVLLETLSALFSSEIESIQIGNHHKISMDLGLHNLLDRR